MVIYLLLILIAFGLGYLICVNASHEEGFLKSLGIGIGAFIFISILLFVIWGIIHPASVRQLKPMQVPGMNLRR